MSTTPAHVGYEIVSPRDVRLGLTTEKVPRYWADGDPWITHTVNALFLTVPEAERWVMKSARERLPLLTTPTLIQATRDFIRQEAMHSREHDQLNALLPDHGLPVESIEKNYARLLQQLQKLGGADFAASVAASIEHFTATLAEEFYKHPEVLCKIKSPEMQALTCWHLVEETEHKAVSFDIFTETVGDDSERRAYALRVAGMMVASFMILPYYLYLAGYLIARDRKNLTLGGAWRYLKNYYLAPAIVPQVLISGLPYMKRGFHPWQIDNREDIRPFREVYTKTGDAIAATAALLDGLKQSKRMKTRRHKGRLQLVSSR